MIETMTTLERAEAAERAMSEELDRVVVKSVLFTSGEQDPTKPAQRPPDQGKRYLMGPDPRLPRMPDKPTLLDFFKYRFAPANHLCRARGSRRRAGDERSSSCPARHHRRGSSAATAATGQLSPTWTQRSAGPSGITRAAFRRRVRGYSYPAMYVKLFGGSPPMPTSSGRITRRASTGGTCRRA
jgi:hypothetical protein